jgi:hypothetical protein
MEASSPAGIEHAIKDAGFSRSVNKLGEFVVRKKNPAREQREVFLNFALFFLRNPGRCWPLVTGYLPSGSLT